MVWIFEAIQWIINPVELFAKAERLTLCNVNGVGMDFVALQFA